MLYYCSTEEWLKLFSAADIPCAPVNTLDKALREAEEENRGMIVSFPLPSGEIVKGVGNPVKIYTKENLSPPPKFGEHTKKVLAELLNYSEEKISKLINSKVCYG